MVSINMGSAVFVFVLCLFARHVSSSKSVPLEEWKNSSDPGKYEIVRRFINYAIAYNEIDIKDEHKYCTLEDDENGTARLIDVMLTSCVHRDFFPRILSSAQVSLKKVTKNDEEAPKEHNYGRKTPPRRKKPDPEKPRNTTESDDDDESTIHKYLAFALVLPKHPFSRELIDSLHTVAPLFPHITIYFGIGYEYQELCSQYGVRSFPKLLFFHNGLLLNKYSKSRDPASLAYQFSKWTHSLPVALPVAHTASRAARKGIFTNYNSSSYFHVTNDSNWMVQRADAWLQKASAGRSVEPLITLSPTAVKWDFEIFIISGCYVALRVIYSALVASQSMSVGSVQETQEEQRGAAADVTAGAE
jgi:hypothetical protein